MSQHRAGIKAAAMHQDDDIIIRDFAHGDTLTGHTGDHASFDMGSLWQWDITGTLIPVLTFDIQLVQPIGGCIRDRIGCGLV